MAISKIDYLTVSLGQHKSAGEVSTVEVLNMFASILPDIYKNTCRDMICSEGRSQRVSQFGICVALQYGTAKKRGWMYSIQLSGDYWHAIERNHDAVLQILSDFCEWRVSRLDLAADVCVPLEDWRDYYKAAFEAEVYILNGVMDARTVYYGSRKSQFYCRCYNKTDSDPKHYPAPDGFVQVRLEVEVKRVKGELVLDRAFDTEFTDHLFMQRVHKAVSNDSSGFIEQFFATADAGAKIKTVKRQIGNLESTVDYVLDAFAPYFTAVMNSQLVADRYDGIEVLNEKGKKILAVIDQDMEVRRE